MKRREDFTSLEAEGSSIIRLTLITSKGDFPLGLPVSDERLEQTRKMLEVDDFAQASVKDVQVSAPYMADLIPLDAVTVEEANELAGWLQQMEREDGVRRTEFGLVRRLSLPYPQQEDIGPSMC